MIPLTLAAALLTGALAGLLAGLLGIGGGAIIVPALLWLFALPPPLGLAGDPALIPQLAVATSLASVVATGAASAHAHHRQGAVDWSDVARLLPGLLLGASLGAVVAAWLPGIWLKRLFGVFLLYTGARMLMGRASTPDAKPPGRRTLFLAGGGIGALSAMLGIGGGTLVVPFLARSGLTMHRAVATASACGVPLALAGSIGFMFGGWQRAGLPTHSLGFVHWPTALALILASVPLATLGARLAHRLPTTTLKRLFGMLLLLLGTRLLFA